MAKAIAGGLRALVREILGVGDVLRFFFGVGDAAIGGQQAIFIFIGETANGFGFIYSARVKTHYVIPFIDGLGDDAVVVEGIFHSGGAGAAGIDDERADAIFLFAGFMAKDLESENILGGFFIGDGVVVDRDFKGCALHSVIETGLPIESL